MLNVLKRPVAHIRFIALVQTGIGSLTPTTTSYNIILRRNHTTSDYDTDTRIILSEANRQRCLDKMMNSPPLNMKPTGNAREKSFAAVLIAICLDENESNPSILFTRRSRSLRRHMSQIAFPGGMKDNDEDYIQCAVRETEEEVGLLPHRVEIWGSGGLVTPPLTAAIMPVVGVVKNFKLSELKLNEAEVEEAFTVPISVLANPQTLRYTQFKSGYSAPTFIVGNTKIWGITGFLTNLFLNCLLPPEMNKLKKCVRFIRPYKSNVKYI